MAEGEGESFVSGSEYVFEFYCEFCNEEGLHKEAAGRCTECDEYLCSKCIGNHKGNRLSRHHEILDKDMLQNTPPSSDCVRKDITTTCQQHKGRPVEYYCKTHEKLACNRCFVKDHKTCSDINDIIEASESIFNGKDYKDFIQQLDSLKAQVNNIITKSREQTTKSKRYCLEAKESVRKFRDEVISILDDIQTSIDNQADTIASMDVAKMETLENTCSPMQETIDKISSELESLKSDNRVCQAYIRMKETATDVEMIKQKINEAEGNNTIKTYTFVPNTDLTEFLSRPDVLGLLSMENKVEKKEQITTSVIKTVSSASFVQDIDVRSKSDTSCGITGSALLSSCKLVLVDYKNCKIKLVDQRSMNITNEMRVAGYPWDVTVIKEDQVAVTDGKNNKILILKVTDTITLEREIKVSGQCRGIVFSKNQLVVTYVNPPYYIEIIDLYGNVNSKIEIDKDGNKLFIYPQYVCASSDGDTLYVSDTSAHKVFSLSRDSSIKAIYTDTDLRSPEKVCLDHRSNVYVCCFYSKNIHMLTPDFTKIRFILTQTDGLTNSVYSVSHCKHTDRLYVGMSDNDKVKVYQLS